MAASALSSLLYLCVAFCLLSSAAFSAESEAGSLTYAISRIASAVLHKPGALAWSADSRKLAFISGKVTLLDTGSNRRQEVDIPDPLFLSWAADGPLYVLYRESGQKKLCRIDTETLGRKDLPISSDPQALVALPDTGGLLLVSVSIDQKRLWTEFSYMLALFDPDKGSGKKLFEMQKRLPTKNLPADYINGWLWTGTRPADSTILTVEPVKPPVIMPYLQIGLFDYLTEKSREIGRIINGGMSTAASWSPDGRRFAFPDDQKHLAIFDSEGSAAINPETIEDINGSFPSWNPKGSQIYFGGHILRSDGQQKETLFPGAYDSLGVWSPDGTKIAILNGQDLHLLTGYIPSLIPPDKVFPGDLVRKLFLLKELLSEGLITTQEFENRRDNLIRSFK